MNMLATNRTTKAMPLTGAQLGQPLGRGAARRPRSAGRFETCQPMTFPLCLVGEPVTWLSGNEDGPAADPAVAKVLDGVVGGFQGVAGGAEHDLALAGEGDEAAQIGVGADEVSDDGDFSQDELEGG